MPKDCPLPVTSLTEGGMKDTRNSVPVAGWPPTSRLTRTLTPTPTAGHDTCQQRVDCPSQRASEMRTGEGGQRRPMVKAPTRCPHRTHPKITYIPRQHSRTTYIQGQDPVMLLQGSCTDLGVCDGHGARARRCAGTKGAHNQHRWSVTYGSEVGAWASGVRRRVSRGGGPKWHHAHAR